jgi:hypothetical protein
MFYHTADEYPYHYSTDGVSTFNANGRDIYCTSHDLAICGLCDIGDFFYFLF